MWVAAGQWPPPPPPPQAHAQTQAPANVPPRLLNRSANLKVPSTSSVPLTTNSFSFSFSRHPHLISSAADLAAACCASDAMSAAANVSSWTLMLQAYVRNGQIKLAQNLFDTMPQTCRNDFAWNSLISGYFRCGQVDTARQIFDARKSHWKVVTWTAVISGYAHNSRFKDAFDLFLEMLKNGLKPNKITLISILPAVAHLGALSHGQWIHSYVQKTGMCSDPVLGSALLNMYSKCGCIDKALLVFDKLEEKVISAWNSIILGLGANGRCKDAMILFWRMRKENGIRPNEVTFTGVLSACSHAGLITEGYKIFLLFTNTYKLIPNLKHYGCMIDMLARGGLIEEALELIEKMPFEPNPVIWKTLLGACRVRKDVEMANRVWSKVMESGGQDSGFYAILCNILKEGGRLEEAGRVRREMNDRGIKKPAGCSWVEVDGAVHEFVMGRESFHPQSRRIVDVLREMDGLIKLEEEFEFEFDLTQP